MQFFVRFLAGRKVLFRFDDAGSWSRFDSGTWTPVPIDRESFLLDPFVEELSADQARALELELRL